MTKKQLNIVIVDVILIYSLAIIIGIALRSLQFNPPSPYYDLFKDLIPFIFAIPAAYLGYCFQQRANYHSLLCSLWGKLVYSVTKATHYTYFEVTTPEQFFDILSSISICIDELRSVYRNIGEGKRSIGIYPYEPIKNIYTCFQSLGYGKLDPIKKSRVRNEIMGNWKSIRSNFLAEFDRAVPTKVVSPYVRNEKIK